MRLERRTIVEIAGGVSSVGIGVMFHVVFGFEVPAIVFILGGAIAIVWALEKRFRDWYRKKSRTNGKQGNVLASHSTGYHTIDITDEGIQTKSLYIPYSSVRRCSFHRSESSNLGGKTTRCIIEYVDSQGRIREAKLGGKGFYAGLNIHADIMRFSKKHGYRFRQQAGKEMTYLARWLRKLGVESQFVEPDVNCNWVSGGEGGVFCSWHIDLGGLKLKHSNIDVITMREGGRREKKSSAAQYDIIPRYEFEFQYYFDCTIQIEPAPDIICFGKPVKKFPGRVVDYHWEDWKGIKLALNEDARLRKMLVEAKAPAIQVKRNHIEIRDKYLLSPKFFELIDIIAGHVKEACQ